MGIPLENSSQGFPLRPLTPPTRPLMFVCANRQWREHMHTDMFISGKRFAQFVCATVPRCTSGTPFEVQQTPEGDSFRILGANQCASITYVIKVPLHIEVSSLSLDPHYTPRFINAAPSLVYRPADVAVMFYTFAELLQRSLNTMRHIFPLI